ncbi:hypothetical protein [Bacillus altitudinis]|uniref:hypothetical protein n=1 Tax=Bacillus altitudinis TaxID=293387 RepID=UPI002100DF55|nr:hypothetical protein [Bacillus altitudinis]UTV34847.1 hypothetical protein NM966_19835 [Bacillus altitudinis]
MKDDQNYMDGVTDETYRNYERTSFKKRMEFTDTDYFKVVSFSVKLYKQAAEMKTDILGNKLSDEEIEIAKNLLSRMPNELAMHQKAYDEDNKED